MAVRPVLRPVPTENYCFQMDTSYALVATLHGFTLLRTGAIMGLLAQAKIPIVTER